ncbi:MAG TPA: arylsulfatase [Candidatus Binatia bacterium]|nr:arylsulfatase [Candidatus Binatia bacterium]
MSKPLVYRDGEPFPGRAAASFRDSFPAWPVPARAPAGAPNVVLIVLDDVGFAQIGCFGSDIDTPRFDGLAADGLRYRNFHTTAMCSPTRACLLTGRNHHTCAMGGITDLCMGFPGYNGRVPKSCGFVSEVLRQAGWATFAVGKWHLAPSDEQHAAAPRDRWPLGQGFERYYGFMGGETNQFAPDLVCDNSPIRLTPSAGYHLTEDLVDHAIQRVTDVRTADPDKPFLLYLALGACHAPHQAPREWIERYRGRFDEGWDAWRARTLERQVASGIVPPGTTLSARPPWVQEWASLPADERHAYARMMEVYAGFLSHTDHHVGRLIDFLAASGELDRTLVLALSDNGASAEGGPHGTFNENFIFNGLPHDIEATRAMLDQLGSAQTYGHYPWGWALAGNTPFRRWKRETHEGGIGDPLIVRWPAITDRGAVRSQYVHAIDVAATILDVTGTAMPAMLNGVPQEPLAGASFARSLTDATAPEHRETQYYEQFACRAIYHRGWKAVTYHAMMDGLYTDEDDPDRPFDQDRWELYHVAEDPSESRDLAAAEPEKLRALQELWWSEAGRYGVLPLQSRRMFAAGRPHAVRPRERVVLRSGASPLPEDLAPNVKMRPHRIIADVEIATGSEGVLVAQGGRFGGFSLYLHGGRLHYTSNFAGIERTTVSSPQPLAPGRHVVGVALEPAGGNGMRAELVVGDDVVAVAEAPRTAPYRFALAGEGLCCGYDDGTPVADVYESPFTFTGTIHEAVIDVSGTPVVDLVAELRRAWMTQ